MKIYVTPVFVFLGVLGNITNVVVFAKSRLRKISCSPYLTLLSVVDTCFLVTLFSLWLINFDLDVYAISGACQVVKLLISGASFVSVWMVTALALDRLLMVYPSVHPCLLACPGKRPKLTVLCIGTSGFVIYFNLCLLYSQYQMPHAGGKYICIPEPESYQVLGTLEKLDAIFDFILPSLMIIIINALTMFHLGRLVQTGRNVPRVRQRNANVASMQQRSKVEMTMTKVSLTITSMFLLLNMPGHILRLIVMIAEHQENFILDPSLFLTQQLLMNLFFLRPVLTAVFCIAFCASYRKAIRSMAAAICLKVHIYCQKSSPKALWRQRRNNVNTDICLEVLWRTLLTR